MPVVKPEQLISLQRNAQNIRNICILAHVDHGKTSLTDALLATNGIISPKLAGKIRYLDARPDEQLRGITMESSAISLYFSMLRRPAPEAAPEMKEYLINLIDSPGHIDFSSEVSTASRLCDGAVVLVDAVEGVCSQTVTVLRQTWIERMKPLLVINKIDRLITELKMSPSEAYTHLSKLLEQVNAVVGSFYQGERMEEDLKWREKMEEKLAAAANDPVKHSSAVTTGAAAQDAEGVVTNSAHGEFEERDDADLYFAPERNNVIFSSAIDGWAFTVKQFAAIYERKLGIKRAILEKVLWGDYYLDPKTKRVLGQKHLKGRNLKPMFVQLVLETIWAVYEASVDGDRGKGDPAMVEKITKSLSITLPPHVLRSKDPRSILTALFSAWLPLSTALLVTTIEHLPSPPVAQADRLPAMIEESPGAEHVDPAVKQAMVEFRTEKTEPAVAYVSKMVAIPQSELPENRRRAGGLSAEEAREMARKKRAEIARAQQLSSGDVGGMTRALATVSLGEGEEEEEPEASHEEEEDPEHLIGFARLYSGSLSVGDEVYVLAPKFSPADPHAHPEPQKVTITALYLLMGRSLEPLRTVPAGVVFGIAGLEGHILKSGTLCSQLEGSVNLAGLNMGSQPIVRVALEPANPMDLGKMIDGLRLLVQSDPCAEYEVLENGEHVILTAGELHLERCLKDLRERFAKCDIQAGEPIVPYRETIVSAPEMAPPREKDLPRGTVAGVTSSKQISIRLRVRPLPAAVTNFLSKNASSIKQFYSQNKAEERRGRQKGDSQPVEEGGEEIEAAGGDETSIISLDDFQKSLKKAFEEIKADREVWASAIDNIAAFGPRRVGSNLLIDASSNGIFKRFLRHAQQSEQSPNGTESPAPSATDSLTARDFADKIGYAFQLATAQGPLCNEPIQGVAVFIEDVSIAIPAEEESTAREKLGRLTGEVIRTVRDSIHQGFLDWSPRLLLAMYSCEIQASTEVLGRVYGVITRRRGRILSEALKEGTPFFTILSVLPVAESFGFSDEIRKRTSGAASPQLIFAGFEMLDIDPFWIPFTEEELEDLGELADKENVAKRYMDRVRSRKGLFIQGKKLVVDAEKQKTLKR
ncbi:P-loop containing nucleoside triphosphate hydrolase protein [Xylona heveae TC161]|uniref:Elongation factor-like 1 n=1 Tax=Xylona heveae (strain CBS 132557 / TC161) TaxID=1328760 RepID=A0A165JUE8_XYLHT|nr:P-loop containing nucleoside triphosphate hydrolase protein [Xylona heveae TC161]KZF26643.1 P-loop containing nucleoside triphosphate hydrolase protein [Xylona heveae TC161]